MNLFEHLKQLNRIEPNSVYAEHSRRRIISSPQKTKLPFWRTFVFRGSAMATAALLLVIIGGGYSMLKYLKTSGGLDRGALSAEAQAIDMQIELMNVNYSSLPFAAAHPKAILPAGKGTGFAGTGTATSTPPTATSTPGITIDDALKALAQ